MKAITYVGPFDSGYLLDPVTRKEYPFQQGKEIYVPDELADQCEDFEVRDASPEEVAAAEELERLARLGKPPARSTEEITKQEGELN